MEQLYLVWSQPATASEKDLSFHNKVIPVIFSIVRHHQINSWPQGEGKTI